jgi:hypothetical protein
MSATATIQVSRETRDRLNRIAAARGISAGELVEELATRAEGLALLSEMATHYDRLKTDAGAWEHYRAEVAAWDATTNDGLAPIR